MLRTLEALEEFDEDEPPEEIPEDEEGPESSTERLWLERTLER